MNTRTKKITAAAALLAICIISQFFKNFSVYITGPIINACLILAVLTCGLFWGAALAIITPVTAFLITGAPIMKVVPAIMPLVMAGNLVLVIVVWLIAGRKKGNSASRFNVKIGEKRTVTLDVLLGGIIGSVAKGAFMALTISYGVLSVVTLPEAMQAKLPILRTTYSVTQLFTALIGTAYACVIWAALKKAFTDISDK
ncbi:MAG: ECF transporter S component [Lachnospiraceae bacterium]|nr:ECF transporter S component [Lachnospiraceae bacterium]